MTEQKQLEQLKEICTKWDVTVENLTVLMITLKTVGFPPTHEFANTLRALADAIDSPVGRP